MINNDRHSSLASYRLIKDSHLIKIKKRSSCGGIDEHQFGHNDFRHVRDSLRRRYPRATRTTSTNSTNKRLVNHKVQQSQQNFSKSYFSKTDIHF